jgi:uncharacterized protein YjbI with pentapeptide repeats
VTAPDAQKLLESANSSSEQVGVLHLGFIAACAYVIVIAIGRTDLDLLIGKGIRLPIIDTEVPIVGFFAFAPWILVIVHFNLLLHLQLLARKLHAFNDADEDGELRDQLRIFPITYFLAGRTDERTKKLLSLMASITVILLPLLTLLLLQLQFLAYQSEFITWTQRFAIWLDLAQLAYFWPIIAELKGASCSIKERWNSFHQTYLPRIRDWIAPTLSGIGLMLVICGSLWLAVAGFIAVCFSALISVLYEQHKATRYAAIAALSAPPLFMALILKMSIFESAFSYLLSLEITIIVNVLLESLRRQLTSLSTIFLIITGYLSLSLSLGFQVDGERLEKLLLTWPSNGEQRTLFSDLFINEKRILNLQEYRLFANHLDPEIIVQLRSTDWAKALPKVEPVILQGRSLRHANLYSALLCRADLRHADLRGASLYNVQLQNAHLSHAQLQGADLSYAHLQGAELSYAHLQGAVLFEAKIQGADLSHAHLQGAVLLITKLQGADLSYAQLQGAMLMATQLQGADLSYAQLQGADLSYAQLQGADLHEANLYAAQFEETELNMIDVRKLKLTPLIKSEQSTLIKTLKTAIADKKILQSTIARFQNSTIPNSHKYRLQSCLSTDILPLPCDKRYDPRNPKDYNEFKQQLYLILDNLAAESPDIALGIIHQIPNPQRMYIVDSSRFGLATVLIKRLNDSNAPGLQALSDEDKKRLTVLAKAEQEWLKKNNLSDTSITDR